MKVDYEFKKGEFNKFNEVNQNMKHLFTQYSIYNGLVFGDYLPEQGKHYAKINYNLPELLDNALITINSVVLFNTQKDYKKNIKGYKIENENLYLVMTDMDDVLIGTSIDFDGLAATKKQKSYEEADNIINDSRLYIPLSDSDIEDMVVYKTKITIAHDKFKVYLTKDIIPNVKKTDYIDISFSETNIKTVFQMIIRINRGGTILTHHVYRCLYI